MKKFIEEFKAFALRGNMLDMAVGIIIGGAFTAVVNALTANFIQPFLTMVTTFHLYSPSEMVGFGVNFIVALINFLIMALALFLLIKGINKLMTLGKKQEQAPVVSKVCPYCKSEIAVDATRCPHCTSVLSDENAQ